MTVGLDTSVVLRLLIGEPRTQMEVARRRIERAVAAGEQVVVTDLVIAEVVHALRHHYGVPAAEAVGRLRDLLGSGVVRWILPEPRRPGDPRGGAGLVSWIASSLPDTAPSERRPPPSIVPRPGWKAACSCAPDRRRRSEMRGALDEETDDIGQLDRKVAIR